MFKVQDEKSFWGSGLELVEKAIHSAHAMGIESEKINHRLIRYYTAENIINKPDRLGKEAAYNYSHLLQLLVARRMVQSGAQLANIKRFNQSASIPELEKALSDEASAKVKQMKLEQLAVKELPTPSTSPQSQLYAAQTHELQKTGAILEDYMVELEMIVKRLKEIEYVTKDHLSMMVIKFDELMAKNEMLMQEQQYQVLNAVQLLQMQMKDLETKIDDLRK